MSNPELSEIVGAFIGDGFTNVYGKYNYVFEFAGHPVNDYEYFTTTLIPLMRYLFPYSRPCLSKPRGLMLRYHSKQIFLFFTKNLNMPAGAKSLTVSIPKQFLKNRIDMRAVVRGIFDTDGSVVWDRRRIYRTPYPRLSITTKSKKLARQLMKTLEKLGFNPRLYKDNQQPYSIAYHIDIYGKKQLDKWIKEVGFSNSNHIKRLVP